jgi:phage-related protein
VQYRILYFFSGQNVAILAHAIAKDENQVPDMEIERAIQRKAEFEVNPAVHTYTEEIEDGENK